MLRCIRALSLSVVLLATLLVGCGQSAAAEGKQPVAKQQASSSRSVEIGKREGKIRNYPCNQCHDKIDGGAGTLPDKGTHRNMKAKHFEGVTDCYICHERTDMNSLRLITGERVGLDDSHRLCGQCHGEKLRDWSYGAHGKHVGSWRTDRYRLTCADCHNPHLPALPAVKAMPRPPFPERGIPKGGH